jgi:CHAT domain-containing protein
MLAIPPFAVLASFPALFAPTAPVLSAPLAPGVQEWTLSLGQVRRHVVTLEPGQFVRVKLRQAGIDVVVRIQQPDGTFGPPVDASDGIRGWELASLVATVAGEYAVEVAPRADAEQAGGYALDADAPRPVDDRDRRRLMAEDARARSGLGLPNQVSRERQLTALRWLPVAEEIFRELGETCHEAEAASYQALIRSWRAPAESLDMHARALRLWERCGDRPKRAEMHLHAAEGLLRSARYREATATYEQGLALAKEVGQPDLEVLLLTNLGSSYNMLGQAEKSGLCAEEALPLLRSLGARQGEAVALRNLALSHLRRGNFQQAVDFAHQSLAIRREIGDRRGVGSTLVTLGEIAVVLGEPASARVHLEEAMALASQGHATSGGLPRILSELAKTFDLEGDRSKTLALLEQSLAAHQDMNLPEFEPRALMALGRFHLREGDADAAWEAGVQSVEMLRAAGDRHALAGALELLGSARLALADTDGARAALEESLEHRRAVQDGPGEATALYALARVDRAVGDPQRARERLEGALARLNGVRERIVSPDLRSTWLAHLRGIHEAQVDTLMELHRRDPRAGWDVRAFEASESARARSLLDLLGESRAALRRDVDPELLARERALRERLGARLESQLRAGATSSPVDSDGLAREIHGLSAEYAEVRDRIRTASPHDAALTQAAPLRLEELRARVLDDDTLLLAFGLGRERSYLWVVGRDVFASYPLPEQAAIDQAVARARTAVSRRPRGDDGARALASLSLTLLGPARPHLAGRRLLFVADGSLHHVPFGALPDAQGAPLVATHEVVSAPSASALALLREGGARHRPRRTLAVLADPVFDRTDERLHPAGRAAALPNSPVRPEVQQATRDFGFAGGRLPRLPFTRSEARSVLALAPRDSRLLAVDFEASRVTLEDPALKDYRVVHFATHGLLNDVRPELSGLILSLVDRQGRDLPGLLTAPDVYNLELGAELVVLSGCRTALGKEVRGEGLVGLTRAFMSAGVPRVVASLWPVEDLATAELMRRFYEGMLGPRKLRPAAALRRAQAQMASHRRWGAPYYWAGFQLQGDWR